MSSFYGNSGSTNNSNTASVKKGTDASPIYLNALDYGENIITGTFFYTPKDTTDKTIDYQLPITVYKDSELSNKSAKYEMKENSIWYIYMLEFDNDDNYQLDKIPVRNWDSF